MTSSINGKSARRKALVVGISEYSNLQNLDFCQNDGRRMHEVLESQKYNIAEISGEVSWLELRDTIYDFFVGGNSSDDTLLFYFSGHGVLDFDEVYLASSDTDPDEPYKRGYSFGDLAKMIGKTKSTRVIVILDCCYSGSFNIGKGSKGADTPSKGKVKQAREESAKKGRQIMEAKSKELPQRHLKCLLAASHPYQEAYAKDEHSIFTEYLLKGLEGGDENDESVDNEGNVTPQLLGEYVDRAINRPREGPKQDPIIKTEGSGNIILTSHPNRRKPKDTIPVPIQPGKKKYLTLPILGSVGGLQACSLII
jgi:hypothetical protein